MGLVELVEEIGLKLAFCWLPEVKIDFSSNLNSWL